MKNLRLLAILEAYSITGPARNLLEFARLARDHGVETTIATFSRSETENQFIQTAREMEIPVEAIRESGPLDFAAMRALGDVADRVRPDLIQTHAVKSHFLARLAGLPQRAPWTAFHHGYTWPTPRARAYNQLDRWSLRKARRVITVSMPFREELISRGVNRERIEIVHNAIAPDWGARSSQFAAEAAQTREALGVPHGRKIVLIVGRLSREKDHLTLIGAMGRMRESGVTAHLAIVGEGPERPRIEAHVAQLALTEQVTLTGQRNSAEPYYRIADLAVLSSRSEGSPNALLEAMAAGVPVVATSVGGIPEIVTHGESALLVPPGDREAMSSAMIRLLANEAAIADALTTSARTLIRERHTPEARMRELIRIYLTVAGSDRMRD